MSEPWPSTPAAREEYQAAKDALASAFGVALEEPLDPSALIEAIEQAAAEGRNVAPSATDDAAAEIEAWARGLMEQGDG